MNQTTTRASAHTVLSLKARHLAAAPAHKAVSAKPAVAKPKQVNPNLRAALNAGLPRSIAKALATAPIAVVELTSPQDSVATLALGEAKAGATLGHAAFVKLNVDLNGGDIQTLTRLLGELPVAPATLVYQRPGTLYVTLQGFNDRTVVQQAVLNAAQTATGAA